MCKTQSHTKQIDFSMIDKASTGELVKKNNFISHFPRDH